MKITGHVHEVCAKEEGQTTSGGFWVKRTLVIAIQANEKTIYVAFTFFGENRVRMLEGLTKGQLVDVAFAPESREYQGKWYNDNVGFGVKAYVPASKPMANNAEAKPAEPAEQLPADAPVPTQAMAAMPNENDDLQF